MGVCYRVSRRNVRYGKWLLDGRGFGKEEKRLMWFWVSGNPVAQHDTRRARTSGFDIEVSLHSRLWEQHGSHFSLESAFLGVDWGTAVPLGGWGVDWTGGVFEVAW